MARSLLIPQLNRLLHAAASPAQKQCYLRRRACDAESTQCLLWATPRAAPAVLCPPVRRGLGIVQLHGCGNIAWRITLLQQSRQGWGARFQAQYVRELPCCVLS